MTMADGPGVDGARRGLLIILSSPSGAGKTTMSRRLRAWDPAIRFSVSATTRAPREGEVDGREYHFVSREAFQAMVAEGRMLEHAEVFGNLYGSPRGPVETALEAGADTLFDIDWQGGQQIGRSALGSDVVSIFLLPPSMAELEHRLKAPRPGQRRGDRRTDGEKPRRDQPLGGIPLRAGEPRRRCLRGGAEIHRHRRAAAGDAAALAQRFRPRIER